MGAQKLTFSKHDCSVQHDLRCRHQTCVRANCGSRSGVKRRAYSHIGDLYVFRGRRGDLIKIIWHDSQGACLFTKRLERGRFLWPSLADGVVTISVAQLSYLLSGIDWRMPQATWRPQASG
ncbi:IS66 family insertion sequence element accessory protein TnpB [Tardiphaga sp. vice352]|uniref:IS66 family insertion sequence element accessory protein TnpB n=1 Tax=unclassified Tardiphaga TaxID=2631404 RepID=UPI001163FEF1|nr:IS66 family insertion sequence element accessory protein TnpB [Tardiphaga sp. vice278]QDM20535.1 IS66 family insertion sequence element accessory protein TnpB [Tardiphaga sp. vice154]QDM25663.1 IS66 family insertion sequence element accessory protein TnpB [Tardiphaga sp. vice304]QDM30876.1 IS66 family insertion sequence element accessory protein TnpB [Tardiphaga sp. vice352]